MFAVSGPSQIENLEEKLPPPTWDDPSKPRMPFPTAYVLTREQEDAMVTHACERIRQVAEQLGRPTDGWRGSKAEFPIQAEPNSFFGKREKFTARYYNHVKDRESRGGMWKETNITASLSQRITAQMIARANGYFFGEPDDANWFTADAIGPEDDPLADKIRKYARWKFDRCRVKQRLVQATEFAFVRGEAVVKTTHEERFQIYKRTATILVEQAQGNPIKDAHDDYILRTDAFVPEMEQVPAAAVPQEMGHLAIHEASEHPEAEPMALLPTGRMLLKRDGVTALPANPVWETRVISRKLVTFEGPSTGIVYYKDFLCPLDAVDVQTADIACHLYDRSVMQVAQMFGQQFDAMGDTGVEHFQRAVERLRDLMSDTSHPKSAANQPRVDFEEQDTDRAQEDPLSQLAEVWMTYDADHDGIQEEIMLVLDLRNEAPLYYEYAANVTLRGLRPFDVERAIEIDGRWYGMGAMEYFDPEQEFIDLQINRKNFREGASGHVTFWRPDLTVEGDRDPHLKLHHGATYTLKPSASSEEALKRVYLENDSSELMGLIELFMQFMQMKGGVLTGADRAITNMPSSETLGEEELITQSGQELFEMFLVRLYDGISAILRSVVDVTFANLNREEVFAYFNGQAHEVLTLTPEEVRDISINVRLTITKTKERQTLEYGRAALDLIERFYALPPELQERLADFYRKQLKALRVQDADTIIQPLMSLALPADPEAVAPEAMAA